MRAVLAIGVAAALCVSAVEAGAAPVLRAVVAETGLDAAGRGTRFATLLVGQPVQVLKRMGPKARVRTRAAIVIEGWVPVRSLGMCAREQAPLRVAFDGDPVGYLPAGRCIRLLGKAADPLHPLDPKTETFADPGLALTLRVETRFLSPDLSGVDAFEPILAGFTPYRVQPQPLRPRPDAQPWFTVPAGEWPMRSTHEEGEHAFIEVLGSVVVLQGWQRTDKLYTHLFKDKNAVELARQRLAQRKRPEADPRPWFRTRTKTALFRKAGDRKAIGHLEAGVLCTTNRRSGTWRQVRLERSRHSKPLHRLETLLWVHGDVLEPEKSAFAE